MLRIPLPEDDGFALALSEDRGAEKSRTSRTSTTSKTFEPNDGIASRTLPVLCKKRG